MSNVTISWVTTTPADGDFVANGASVIRSTRSFIQSAMSQEHFYGDGPSGAHRQGSARVFVGANSAISSADTDGRMMWDSTNSQLNYVGSEGVAAIGGARHVSMVTSLPPLSATSRFVMSCVSVTQATWPTGPISMGIPPASALFRPFYFVSVATHAIGADIGPVIPVILDTTTNAPSVYLYNPDGSLSTHTYTVNVMAIGFGPL